jgi:hypothetical protein
MRLLALCASLFPLWDSYRECFLWPSGLWSLPASVIMILCSPTLRSWKLSMGAVEAIDDGTTINLIMEVALSLYRLLIYLCRIDDVDSCHLHFQHDLMFLGLLLAVNL